jgi:phosphohistidine swiveling domain-containing protein
MEKDLVDSIDFGQEWTRKGFHGILHTFFPVAEFPLKSLKDYYGDSYSSVIFFVSDDYVNWYWGSGDLRRLRESLIARVGADPGFLDKLLNDWLDRVEDLNECFRQIDSGNLAKSSDQEILGLYDSMYGAYLEQYALSAGLQEAFSLQAHEFLIPRIREFLEGTGLGDYFVEYSSILSAPVNESFISQRRRGLLRMLDKIQKSETLSGLFAGEAADISRQIKEHPELDEMLDRHAEEFFWIQNNYAEIKVLGKDFFIGELKMMVEDGLDAEAELEKLDSQLPHTKEIKDKLIRDLELPEDIRMLVRITEVFTYMQDERKKNVLICNHYQKLFMDEIGKRTGLSPEEMAYTHFRELKDILLSRKIDRNMLRSRKRHCLCIHTIEGYQVLDGEKVDQIYESNFKIKQNSRNEIKGMAASKGTARGVVKVVKKTHDLVDVQKGDILVADMTRPEMVVAMEKAAAIITDEGGITCHAAIVSRELGIPCLVGTKVATTLLKTGDLVEVDANTGIVKKLSQ